MPENNKSANLNALVIRDARPEDAALLWRFGDRLLEETDHFVRIPGERARDIAEMEALCRIFQETPGWHMIHAWNGTAPIGEAALMPGRTHRTQLTAEVGIGVLKDYWGQGIGQRLMTAIEDRARDAGLHRLELTVFSNNPRAQEFYAKLGYEEEGRKRESVKIEKTGFIDEILMSKLLNADNALQDER